MIADENGARSRVSEILLDERYDDGAYPRHDELQTVGDVRTHGVKALVEKGCSEADAEWLMAKFGGARRGRKPKEA